MGVESPEITPEIENVDVEKASLIGQERSTWSYFAETSQEELEALDEKIDDLREMSEPPELEYIDPTETTVVGTDAFVTNNPTDEYINGFRPNASEEDRGNLRSYMNKLSQKRYFGSSDVRGCVLVVVREPGSETFSAGHIAFNSAEDREGMEGKMGTLTAPIQSDKAEVSIVGGFEEEASIDTIAAVINELENTYDEIDYQTVDALNRSSGDRRPYFDRQEGVVHESGL